MHKATAGKSATNDNPGQYLQTPINPGGQNLGRYRQPASYKEVLAWKIILVAAYAKRNPVHPSLT